ncbi:Guanylate cyclase 32E [Bulinus truncatus]|nr:Guanylate cyclase 32E [Bulinus truncatus]
MSDKVSQLFTYKDDTSRGSVIDVLVMGQLFTYKDDTSRRSVIDVLVIVEIDVYYNTFFYLKDENRITTTSTSPDLVQNWRYEQALASLIWKIDMRDIHLQPEAANSALSMLGTSGPLSTASLSLGPEQEQRFTKMGVYKGTVVALKPVKKKTIDTSSREIKLELKVMRDLRHDNIVQFIGATIEPGITHIVTEYCSKGSLEDILENSDLKLDEMFTASIVSDILKGMIFLHGSAIVSHGNLKSSNCLVDSRWVIKISDFGLCKFKAKQEMPYNGEHANYKRFLWTAPELLRLYKPPPAGTQKGDVYSFGIILYEILNRNGCYGDCHLTPRVSITYVSDKCYITVSMTYVSDKCYITVSMTYVSDKCYITVSMTYVSDKCYITVSMTYVCDKCYITVSMTYVSDKCYITVSMTYVSD